MIGRTLIQLPTTWPAEQEIAIYRQCASNQNLWIEWMRKELEDPKYSKINLVRVAYGDDLRDKSVSETEALLRSYPNLKVIIAPTTVGIAAAGKVITDKNLIGKVKITGLGLPSGWPKHQNGLVPTCSSGTQSMLVTSQHTLL